MHRVWLASNSIADLAHTADMRRHYVTMPKPSSTCYAFYKYGTIETYKYTHSSGLWKSCT